MKSINTEIRSHLNLPNKWLFDNSLKSKPKVGSFQCLVSQVRESQGYKVTSFIELVELIAELGYHNRNYNLLFRGQTNDYKDKNGRTKLYPSIYRPDCGKKSIRTKIIKKRFQDLEVLLKILEKYGKEFSFSKDLFWYDEYKLALIQHYEIHQTPLIDLTQSIHVAATFALLNSNNKGFLYVFGMPHPHGSISHFIDDDMLMVKLQNVCPPTALRPHFQDGYLVGRLPYNPEKTVGDNLAKRLIGKYLLSNVKGNFWGKGFGAIPKSMLFPKNDPFKNKLIEIRNNKIKI